MNDVAVACKEATAQTARKPTNHGELFPTSFMKLTTNSVCCCFEISGK